VHGGKETEDVEGPISADGRRAHGVPLK
jgi:hypothetical protein